MCLLVCVFMYFVVSLFERVCNVLRVYVCVMLFDLLLGCVFVCVCMCLLVCLHEFECVRAR